MTAIDDKWNNMGGPNSPVGNVVQGWVETPTPDGKGSFRHYQRGSIYWKHFTFQFLNVILNFDLCPHAIYGDIRNFWASLGWEQSPLGFPISDEQPARTTDLTLYRFSDFENGVLYWRSGSKDPISGEQRGAQTINLIPVAPSLVRSITNGRLDPTAAGIVEVVKNIVESRVSQQATVKSVEILAVTEYTCVNGVVHNRQHVFRLVLESRSGCILNPVVELKLWTEITYDRNARLVQGILREWQANISNLIIDIGKGDIENALKATLNPMKNTAVMTETLPSGTNVLVVKVMLNGDVNIYIEPICLLTTASARALGLPEDHPDLDAIRSFRDAYLAQLPGGRQLIDIYYWLSPQVVEAIDRAPNAEAIYRTLYEHYIAPAVKLIQAGDLEGVFSAYSASFPAWISAIGRLPNAYAVCQTVVDRLTPLALQLLGEGRTGEFNEQVLKIVEEILRQQPTNQ